MRVVCTIPITSLIPLPFDQLEIWLDQVPLLTTA